MFFSWQTHLILPRESPSFVPGSTGACPWHGFEFSEIIKLTVVFKLFFFQSFPQVLRLCYAPSEMGLHRARCAFHDRTYPSLQLDWEFFGGEQGCWSSEPMASSWHGYLLLQCCPSRDLLPFLWENLRWPRFLVTALVTVSLWLPTSVSICAVQSPTHCLICPF